MLLNICCFSYEHSLQHDKEMGDFFIETLKPTSISDHAEEDYFGSNLGGFWDIDAFIVRSSIVLTLSVIEEFERGMIRILIFHRKDNSQKTNLIPRLEDYKRQSEEWEKIKKSTHTINGRYKILKQYSIDPSSKDSWYNRLFELRIKRNEIAHGLDSPELKFQQFLDFNYDVWRMINHYGNEMKVKQNIEL